MKKIVSRLALAVMLLTCLMAAPFPMSSAYSTYDNFRCVKTTPETLTIVGYEDTGVTEIVIPEKLSGVTVVAIDFEENNPNVAGFSECTKLANITIPATVESIAPGSFSNTALKWIEVDENNTVYSSYEGALYDEAKKKLIQYPIASETEVYELPTTVEIIDSYAFSGATKLKELTLSPNMKEIMDHAFYNCKVLEKVFGYDGIEFIGESAFEKNPKFIEFDIPDTVTTIEKRAFADCTSLVDMELPAALLSLGEEAFINCAKLKGTTIVVDEETTYTEFVIPEGTTTLGNGIFYNCKAIEKAIFPETVTEVPQNTFYGCTALVNVDLPDSLEYIREGAFYGATKLDTFQIGYNGIAIEDNAFYGCSALTKASIYEGLETIGEKAFYKCTKLDSIILPWSIKSIGDSAFEECKGLLSVDISTAEDYQDQYQVVYIGKRTFYNCTSLANITLTPNIGEIDEQAFYNCSALLEVEIPTGISEIKKETFYGCKSLANLEIPENVTKIGESAFYGCTSIADLYISSGVAVIDTNAFFGCSGITDITMEEGVQSIGVSAFEDSTSKKAPFDLIIPESVTSIGERAFFGAAGISSVEINANIETLLQGTFAECDSLAVVTLPENLVTIAGVDKTDKTAKYFGVFEGCPVLSEIVFNDKLTTIGANAFLDSTNKKNLMDITIPENVTSIGANAFEGTDGLNEVIIEAKIEKLEPNTFLSSGVVSVTLPEGLKTIGANAFEDCGNLSEVNFNTDLETIEPYAFSGSTSKKSVLDITIPESVTAIGENAFEDMDGLNFVTFEADLAELSDNMFNGSGVISVTLPENLKVIGVGAFQDCAGLTEIILPETLEEIKTLAFEGSGLTKLYMPDSVTTLGEEAFAGCKVLETVVLSAGLEEIPMQAFNNCAKLTSLEIKEGTKVIGEKAFYACKILTELILPEGLEKIGVNAFTNCKAIETVEFPSTLKTIEEQAFSSCEAILEINLPEGLETIGEKAFNKCEGATSLYVPSTIVNFGEGAFTSCEGLTEIIFADGLTNIGESAFTNCKGLIAVTFPTSMDNIADKAFSGCSSLKSATFSGNAPTVFGVEGKTNSVFAKTDEDFTIYACDGNTGFTIPTWKGYSSMIISISNFEIIPPDKTEYLEGEEFDPTGLRVFVTFDHGMTQEITEFELSGYSSTPGIKTMTVLYLGKTATFEVTVINPSVTGIELVPPTKKTYVESDTSISTTGMVVTAFYENGKTNIVSSSEYRVTGFQPGVMGTQTITVSHMGYTKTFEIEVLSDSLSSIEVVPPAKIDYIEGEEFNPAGMIVRAYYNKGQLNEQVQIVENYEITGFDTERVGNQIVTVTYGGKEAQFVVIVKAKKLLSITVTPPAKTTYYEGELFDSTGMVVTANYDNGKSEEVTGYEVLGYDSNTGTKTITIIYNGVSATFNVVVTVDESLSSLVCDMNLVGRAIIEDSKVTFLLDINNKLMRELDAKIIVASYNSYSNELVGRVRLYDVKLQSGNNEDISVYTYVGTDVGMQNCYFKIFLWDGLDVANGDMLAPNARSIRYTHNQ